MQIVIDISDNDYEYLKNTYFVEDEKRIFEQTEEDRKSTITLFRLINSVKNSEPLPKGHGRLGDLDALQKTYCDNNCGSRKCVDAMDRCIFIDAVLDAPTILEADKEEKE